MKSERFRVAPIAPLEPAKEEATVIYDTKQGGIFVNTDTSKWRVDKEGHFTEDVDGTYTEIGRGSLRKASKNGHPVMVKVFSDTEFPVEVFNADSTVSQHYVRLWLGVENGSKLLLLSNGQFYMTPEVSGTVKYDQAINAKLVNQAIAKSDAIFEQVGSLRNLLTTNKRSLVDAINELSTVTMSSRRLVGFVNYLFYDESLLPLVKPPDLSKALVLSNKRWYYYSAADDQWVLMPVGWNKLHHLVRHLNDFDGKEPAVGELAGFLEDEESTFLWNGEYWERYNAPVDEIGDEYIVQSVFGGDYKGNANGSVVYTPMGWAPLVKG